MKRRKHKRRKRSKRRGKKQEQEDIQPKKKKDNRKKKRLNWRKKKEWWRRIRSRGTNKKEQTQPTRTQKNWPEPWLKKKKLKYLLHKKSSIIKMIERTCCQEGKKQEISNNCPCLLEDEWERKENAATNISGPFRCPDQDSLFRTLGCKNCVLRPRQFGTTFSVVSAKFRRFWKHRFFLCKNEARHRKTQKWWWVRHQK